MKKNIILIILLSLGLFSNNFAMEQREPENIGQSLEKAFNRDLDEQIQIQEEIEELGQLQEEQYKEPKNFFEATPEERKAFIERFKEKLQKMILKESNSRFIDLIIAQAKNINNIHQNK